VLFLYLAACARDAASGPRAPSENAGAPRLPVPGLKDVACDGGDCRALAQGTVLRLPDLAPVGAANALEGADTLRFTTAWEVEGPCGAARCVRALGSDGAPGAPSETVVTAPPLEDDPLPLAEAGEAFTAAWNHGLRLGWRSAFARVVVGPGAKTARLGAATSAVSWPAWLAMHPTGVEAYLVAWPAPVVRGFDPATLDVHWTLPVEGAAQGLFVDPGGRWLLVAVGPGDTERFVDWSVPRSDPAATTDPARDETIRALDRPPMTAVLVIDLATHQVAARAEGTFRRFLPLEHPILATDREVVFLDPGAPPS